MNDLPLLCRRELALIVIVSGAVDIFPMGYDIFLVVDVVVIVVCSGLHVVRHYCGASRYSVCCGKASRKLRVRQWVQVLQDAIICSGGPVRPAAKLLVGFRRHREPGKIPRPRRFPQLEKGDLIHPSNGFRIVGSLRNKGMRAGRLVVDASGVRLGMWRPRISIC